jgi:hypothetical protein
MVKGCGAVLVSRAGKGFVGCEHRAHAIDVTHSYGVEELRRHRGRNES